MARERFGDLTEDRARMRSSTASPPRSIASACVRGPAAARDLGLPGTGADQAATSPSSSSPAAGSSRGPWRIWYPSEGLTSLLSAELRLRSTGGAEDARQLISRSARAARTSLGPPRPPRSTGTSVEKDTQLVPQPGDEWLATFLSRSTDVPEGAPDVPGPASTSPSRAASAAAPWSRRWSACRRPRSGPSGWRRRHRRLQLRGGRRGALQGRAVRALPLPVHPARGRGHGRTPSRSSSSAICGRAATAGPQVEDTGGKRFFREQRELEVPAVEAGRRGRRPGVPPRAPAAASLAEANAPALRLRRADDPHPAAAARADHRQGAASRPRPPARGSPASASCSTASRSSPRASRPTASSSTSATQPRAPHARGRSPSAADGEKLAEDEILLNTGPHRFSVRLVEPQPGKTYQASLRAQAQVEVPEGETPRPRRDLPERRPLLATLYQPPFVQPVLLPPGRGSSPTSAPWPTWRTATPPRTWC